MKGKDLNGFLNRQGKWDQENWRAGIWSGNASSEIASLVSHQESSHWSHINQHEKWQFLRFIWRHKYSQNFKHQESKWIGEIERSQWLIPWLANQKKLVIWFMLICIIWIGNSECSLYNLFKTFLNQGTYKFEFYIKSLFGFSFGLLKSFD